MSQGPVVCRSCGSAALLPLPGLDPVVFCPACCLVQRPSSAETPDQSLASGCATTVQRAADLAQKLTASRQLNQTSLVFQAGSNDGYLLRHYRGAGVAVLGIEPSRKAAAIARQQHGILTRESEFSRLLADRLATQGLRCDVFHAHGVLGRVHDLNGFVRGMRRVLRDDGLAVIETPYVMDLLDSGPSCFQPDELCYFSLTSLCHCFTSQGLIVTDVEHAPLNGGSLRLYAAPALPGVWPSAGLVECLAAEESWNVRAFETYARFARRQAG